MAENLSATRTADALRVALEAGRLSSPALIGRGLEFAVYRAEDERGEPVAIRFPNARHCSNANDAHVDTRELLQQEYALCRELSRSGFPVARPIALIVDRAAVDILLTTYVRGDGSTYRSVDLGRLLARLHGLPPPAVDLVAQKGRPMPTVVSERLVQRWETLRSLGAPLPELPAAAALAHVLASGMSARRLLHLYVRDANIICRNGSIAALLDWSNAMVGDPGLEIARAAEFARLPMNRIDLPDLLRGYAEVAEVSALDTEAAAVCRLDAAVMLALEFRSESPDPELGVQLTDRVLELHADLASAIARTS